MNYVLIIGAKSDIAKAVAEKYAENGYNLYLAGRQINELISFANHLNVKTNNNIECLELDILDYASHTNFYNTLTPKPLGVISLVGYLGEQNLAEQDFTKTQKIIDTNYSGIVSLLNIVANDFIERNSGFIIGVSSVAGDRGRKKNYLYGSAKAAFSTYLSGLRNKLNAHNIQVLTVKPGFVATKMTQGMDLPKKLTTQPKNVANDIYNAQQKGKDVIYSKRLWWLIMIIIKIIPERIFKKLNI